QIPVPPVVRRRMVMLFYTATATLLVASFGPAAPAADLNEDLFQAAKSGDAKAVAAVLAKGADVNGKSAYGATALSFAAEKGHTEVVRLLIRHKADLNARDSFYKATPLDWALQSGHAGVVKALVEADAKGSDAALKFAAGQRNSNVVKALLETGK